MPKTTTDFFRILFILIVAFTLAYGLPSVSWIGTGTLIPQLLLFAFLLGFFINRALARKQTLITSIGIELSRLRHLHHVSEGLRDKIFIKKLFETITRYQQDIAHHFPHTPEMSSAFRDLTHLIYRFRPKHADDPIYADLLATTKDLAMERQRIQSALTSPLSGYSWAVMTINATFVIIFLLAIRETLNSSYFAAGATISGILVALDLLLQTNHLSTDELLNFKQLYRNNIKKTDHH